LLLTRTPSVGRLSSFTANSSNALVLRNVNVAKRVPNVTISAIVIWLGCRLKFVPLNATYQVRQRIFDGFLTTALRQPLISAYLLS